MKNSALLVLGVLVLAAGCASVKAPQHAAPPLEASVGGPDPRSVQKAIQEIFVPLWRAAASNAQRVRASPPDEYAATTWAMLDARVGSFNGTAALERATAPSDSRDLLVISDWLGWRVVAENADPRYSYGYAANLQHMIDQDGARGKSAAVFLIHARLALAIDGARCVDRASPDSIRTAYETQEYVRPIVDAVGRMPKKEIAYATVQAVAIEEMRGERPLLPGLCTRGASTMQKAIAAGRQPVPMNPADPRAANSPGRNFTLDVSGIEPDLVPVDQWRKERRRILDEYIARISKDLQ